MRRFRRSSITTGIEMAAIEKKRAWLANIVSILDERKIGGFCVEL
jgi:hypothetical protein